MSELLDFQKSQFAITTQHAIEGLQLINAEKFNGNHVNALITPCPLYAPGDLSASTIALHPQSIADSRVGKKWSATTTAVEALTGYLRERQGDLELTVAFADTGVLLSHVPEIEHHDAVANHIGLYQGEIDTFCQERGIKYSFTTFSDLGVNFPRFVNLREKPPTLKPTDYEADSNSVLEALNEYLVKQGIPNHIHNNKTARNRINDLMKANGVETTFWLVAGYLAFDYMIPALLGQNGVYMSVERFDPVFRIASLTEGLKGYPRLEVKPRN